MNQALSTLIREHYQTLRGYVSAGMESGKDEARVFMNANENPYELPGLEGFNRYPEPQPPALLDAYARYLDVEAAHIVMTRGADEAIVVLSRLFCEPGQDAVLICTPTFGMYGVNANATPAQTIDVPLLREADGFELNTDEIIKAASEQPVKLIFLCSPNNPTGNSFSQADIERICKSTEGHAVVVLDETYIDFSELGSMTRKLSLLPNLLILRTLSKSHSMAGMRMGCLLSADEEFIQLVRQKCLDAYPLPLASVQAALSALSHSMQATVQSNIANLRLQRERLRQAFTKASVVRQVFPSDANFLLIEMDSANDFVSHCAKHNIVLRNFSDHSGTKNCVRISVGTAPQNDQLIEQLLNFSKTHTKGA